MTKSLIGSGVLGDWMIPLFTLLGVVLGALVTGISNVFVEAQKSKGELKLEEKKFEENKRLERQKLDSDLVKLALQSSGVNGAKTLGFMVQTYLIEDPEIRDGITRYLASNITVPILRGTFEENFPWNAKDIITISAPHGGPFASVNTEGVVKLQTPIRTATGTDHSAYILYQSEIKSPAASFSPNGEALFVYNNKEAAIYFTRPDTIRGEQRFIPPIRISPPNGISSIWLSYPDGKTIIVTGTDNKQVRYDLDGNEIKQ